MTKSKTKAKQKPLPDEQIQRAKSTDVRELAAGYSELRTCASGGKELAGPCPECGGDDRFHCTEDWWFCRQCHPERGDAIEFVRWKDGQDFRGAVETLVGVELPKASELAKATPTTKAASVDDYDWHSPKWQDRNTKGLATMQAALFAPEGKAAREYLLSRGLHPETWKAFGLGYNPLAKVSGAKQKAAAIAMPWIVGGALRGIRYRYLKTQGRQKTISEYGSRFGGALFGGHVMGSWLPAVRTLVLVEGEINAMSVWQMGHNVGIDVLSIGSESTKLSGAMIERLEQYRTIVVWADEPNVSKSIRDKLQGAYGISSPDGKDANDILQLSPDVLGGVLSEFRLAACTNSVEPQTLLWDLWDAALFENGVDAGTAGVIERIAGGLGVDAPLFEVDGRWYGELTEGDPLAVVSAANPKGCEASTL